MTTEQQQKPWEKYGDAEVVAAPGTDDSQGQGGYNNKPWEKYGGSTVVDVEEIDRGDVADAYEQGLAARAEAQAANMTGLEKTADWFGDVARGTFFGSVSDPIAAWILSKKFADQGVTYDQAYEVIQANHAATKNTSADITGAILGGGLLYKAGNAALKQTVKRGYAQGAMKYLTRDKIWNRFLGTTAAAGGAGLAEEGIRTTLEETWDATAGQGFDGERVLESAVTGAVIGGVAGNAMAVAQGAGRPAWDFMKRMVGVDSAQGDMAVRRMLKEYRMQGETVEEAAERFQQETMRFANQNGRMPAAAEILKPEQVRNLSEVVREHTGLDIRARELGEKGVRRALDEYERVVTRGTGTVPSPDAVRLQVEDLFTDVMTRHGRKMVPVSNEVTDMLVGNRKLIASMTTSDNKGAQRLAKLLDAKANVSGLRTKVRDLLDQNATAAERDSVAELGLELAEEMDRLFKEGGAESSRLAELQNLIQLQKAITKKLQTGRGATRAGFNLDEMRPMLQRAEAELKNFEENGLLLDLSSANDIRRMASEAYNMARRGDDAFAMNQARQVRDATAMIGRNEVPEYGDVVKAFNLENLRAEAIEAGRPAARGDVILEDLQARLQGGRMPRGPRQSKPEQLASIRKGTGEGMRLELSQAIRKGDKAGVAAAKRLAGSPQAKGSLAEALPNMEAKEISRQASKVVDTYENMGMLVGARSKSELAKELEDAQDMATGALFGNIGGAARVGLFRKIMRDLKMPRGTAEKVVDMLGDPDQVEPALRYLQSRKIRVAPLFAAITAHLTEPVPND